MITLTLLGGTSLRSDGEPLAGPASQRHRLALLALLAHAHPGGLSRERAISLLWPDRDEALARNLLSQGVHALRRTLGPGAVSSGGDDLMWGPDAPSCDLTAFRAAVARGDLAEATSHYGGVFLEGFHLPGAPDFAHWADGAREALRQEAGGALEHLAREATARGNPTEAARLWLRRSALDPLNARVTLRLMEALEAAGDRAGALRQARLHATLLADEFEAEPDPDVLEAEMRLREAPLPGTIPPPSRLDLPSREEPIPAEDGLGVAPHPGERWRAGRLAVSAGVMAMLAVFLYLLGPRDSVHLDPGLVAVAPFSNHTGDPSLDPLGAMAADWILEGLHRSRIVEVVPLTAILEGRSTGPATSDPEQGPLHRLAASTGAGQILTGSYYLEGDSLRFLGRLGDALGARVILSIGPISSHRDAPLDAVVEFRNRVMGGMGLLADSSKAARDAGQNPPSYASYLAYVDATYAFLAREWARAAELNRQAIAHDPEFLGAHLLLAWSYGNLGNRAGVREVAEVIDARREGLSPGQAKSFDLLMALHSGDPGASYEAAAAAARTLPGSLPHVQWGVEAARSMNRPAEAIRILSAIDPSRGEVRGWILYWEYLTRSHHLLGEHRNELRAARRGRQLHPDDPAFLFLEARARIGLGQPQRVSALVDQRMVLGESREPTPLSMMSRLANELAVHGFHDESIALHRRALSWYESRPRELQEELAPAAGLVYMYAGSTDRAIAIAEGALARDSSDLAGLSLLARSRARAGDLDGARAAANRIAALEGEPNNGLRDRHLSCIEAALGNTGRAVELLQASLAAMGDWTSVHSGPCFIPLQNDAGFQALMYPRDAGGPGELARR